MPNLLRPLASVAFAIGVPFLAALVAGALGWGFPWAIALVMTVALAAAGWMLGEWLARRIAADRSKP